MGDSFRIACLQTPAFGLDEAVKAADYLLREVERAASLNPAPDLLLLPECAYPAYFLAPVQDQDIDSYLRDLGAPDTAAFCAALSERARRYGVAIAAGLALPGPGGLENGLVLWDRDGREVRRTAKMFLWHFDGCWFNPGQDVAIAEAAGVNLGLFICADGRLPEIPRLLALGGADLLLDATNWVTTGRDPKQLPNSQADYMMRVRAMENRVYVAAANKVGREADTIVYCGKSTVIGPDGRVLAVASTDQPEILVAEVPLEGGRLAGAGRYAPLDGVLDPLGARRPRAYPRLSLEEAHGITTDPYIAVAQVAEEDGASVDRLLADLEVFGAALVLLPEGRPGGPGLDFWLERSRQRGCYLLATGDSAMDGAIGGAVAKAAGGRRQRAAWLLLRGEVIHTWVKGHLSLDEADYVAGPAEPDLWEGPWGKVGVMQGGEGLLPEVARGLALAGADLILWPARHPGPTPELFARTRAAENRVFVAMANPAVAGGESLIATPDQAVAARTFPGARQAVGATLVLGISRHKELAPGTDALGGHRTSAFKRLA